MRASSGEARSSSVPSGRILLRNERRNSVKSTMDADREATAVQSAFMAAGGLRAISRHSAARSTTNTTSRISVVSRAAPAIRALSTRRLRSRRPEKSNPPPTRRNSRISVVSCCCVSIHARLVEGVNAPTCACPRGEEQYARSISRSDSNSRTRALLRSRGWGDMHDHVTRNQRDGGLVEGARFNKRKRAGSFSAGSA